jgi:putative ABC transport system substrate-binding protein
MTGKILIWLLVTLFLITASMPQAQQPKKLRRIGYLTSSLVDPRNPNLEAFRQGLRNLGHTEGQDIIIEYRWAEGKNDRLPDLAADLVRLNVDLIVATGGPAANAAKNATKKIPIIFTQVAAPDKTGLVKSVAQPGGNVTGLTNIGEEVGGKRLELIKETVPKAFVVAVLWDSTTSPSSLKSTERAGQVLGVELQVLQVKKRDEFEEAFRAAAKSRAAALTVLSSGIFHTHRDALVALAAKERLPAVYEHKNYVDAGGLMSYGPDLPEIFRRAAVYVDKILKGSKPADLPVEQPTKFELVINLKTAKQIGLTIPPNVLARADKVIK